MQKILNKSGVRWRLALNSFLAFISFDCFSNNFADLMTKKILCWKDKWLLQSLCYFVFNENYSVILFIQQKNNNKLLLCQFSKFVFAGFFFGFINVTLERWKFMISRKIKTSASGAASATATVLSKMTLWLVAAAIK